MKQIARLATRVTLAVVLGAYVFACWTAVSLALAAFFTAIAVIAVMRAR